MPQPTVDQLHDGFSVDGGVTRGAQEGTGFVSPMAFGDFLVTGVVLVLLLGVATNMLTTTIERRTNNRPLAHGLATIALILGAIGVWWMYANWALVKPTRFSIIFPSAMIAAIWWMTESHFRTLRTKAKRVDVAETDSKNARADRDEKVAAAERDRDEKVAAAERDRDEKVAAVIHRVQSEHDALLTSERPWTDNPFSFLKIKPVNCFVVTKGTAANNGRCVTLRINVENTFTKPRHVWIIANIAIYRHGETSPICTLPVPVIGGEIPARHNMDLAPVWQATMTQDQANDVAAAIRAGRIQVRLVQTSVTTVVDLATKPKTVTRVDGNWSDPVTVEDYVTD